MDKFEMVRFTDENFELDVRADSENDTVWLTQDEMAVLFDAARSTITYHINNIFSSNELEKILRSKKSTEGSITDQPNYIIWMSFYQLVIA